MNIIFCWHDWNKWSKAIESYVGSLHQVCDCKKCGAIKHRTAVSMFKAHLTSDSVNRTLEELK